MFPAKFDGPAKTRSRSIRTAILLPPHPPTRLRIRLRLKTLRRGQIQRCVFSHLFDRFLTRFQQGVKFLPPGLHLFLFSAASTSKSSAETTSGGVGVRHGILRFFKAGQTIVEDWDNIQEELVSDRSIASSRRRRGPVIPGEEEGEEEIVVEQDRLKALDSTLAPYPNDLAKEWNKLVSFITPVTLARVIGIDTRGNARVDAVMGSTADEEELKAAGGRQTWGKERPDFVTDEGEVEGDDEMGELLVFERVDLKKSWPIGAVGEELTRWSQDKSWLLSSTIKRLEPSTSPFSSLLVRIVLIMCSQAAYKSFSRRCNSASSSTLSSTIFPPLALTKLYFPSSVVPPRYSFLRAPDRHLRTHPTRPRSSPSNLSHSTPPSFKSLPIN